MKNTDINIQNWVWASFKLIVSMTSIVNKILKIGIYIILILFYNNKNTIYNFNMI